MSTVLTFLNWLKTFHESVQPFGRLAEDGYAWYLESILGRIPTIAEIKKLGKINRLTTDPLSVD